MTIILRKIPDNYYLKAFLLFLALVTFAYRLLRMKQDMFRKLITFMSNYPHSYN